MKLSVEISMYPLAQPFAPAIERFIERLRSHADLAVTPRAMSTELSGDYDRVFAVLRISSTGMVIPWSIMPTVVALTARSAERMVSANSGPSGPTMCCWPPRPTTAWWPTAWRAAMPADRHSSSSQFPQT
jgi:uncharacterized protein YqgV (UPF0045/DUF77 family)